MNQDRQNVSGSPFKGVSKQQSAYSFKQPIKELNPVTFKLDRARDRPQMIKKEITYKLFHKLQNTFEDILEENARKFNEMIEQSLSC
ncbi:MAG: hypothetical protein ACXW1T_04585 [Methylophilus sp.]